MFKTFKSAIVVGPRWEELTRTPWPYPRTAYQPGLRLRQMRVEADLQAGHAPRPAAPVPLTVPPAPGLPAPRIDVQEQDRLLRLLRGNPRLVFEARIRRALQVEVEYHRPQARWAAQLLALLDRFEAPPPADLPLPNILDIYRNPLLALHPDRAGLRAMLREEAADSGLLADFARTLDRVLDQWRGEPERLRAYLARQAEIVRRGGCATLEPLVGGPAQYRAWRLRQNRQRNQQRAAQVDPDAILQQHVAWQAQRVRA